MESATEGQLRKVIWTKPKASTLTAIMVQPLPNNGS